jgi:hypothetical protein
LHRDDPGAALRERPHALCDHPPVGRLAIIARLKSGSEELAADLIAKGAPFDPEESGFDRHAVYLSATEVVFVFEGPEVEARVDDLIEDPFRWMVSDAFAEWRPLIEDQPRIARDRYFWERAGGSVAHGRGGGGRRRSGSSGRDRHE